MATLTISLPDSSSTWVDERIRSGDYATPSDYVRSLIERDREERRLTEAELGLLLDEAEASGVGHRSVDEIAAATWPRRTG